MQSQATLFQQLYQIDGYTLRREAYILLTRRLFKFCKENVLSATILRNPPNPPLEKGGEGGISGIARLQKSTLGDGGLLG
jgi:hypothetical protein